MTGTEVAKLMRRLLAACDRLEAAGEPIKAEDMRHPWQAGESPIRTADGFAIHVEATEDMAFRAEQARNPAKIAPCCQCRAALESLQQLALKQAMLPAEAQRVVLGVMDMDGVCKAPQVAVEAMHVAEDGFMSFGRQMACVVFHKTAAGKIEIISQREVADYLSLGEDGEP